ncbi:hypothetical protein [Alicyclobacillus sp. SO9]|uniref:hypothetical protein n=1 Tax=Alicyclobacillus sp. SO9 TaxID=2665646 RepID=UPI0018E6EDC2|nr:hypothetical protein [Alicyclobacillus sp. SO9]QQE79259.1 hypothetical protein GI364_01740 [Alicyclobacillus sp. SO9]
MSQRKLSGATLSIAALMFFSSSLVPVTYAKLKSAQSETITFHVISTGQKDISGARVSCINPDGKVLQSGLTNQHGDWTANLQLKQDPRFNKAEKMGTITAMAVAKGYNESVVFDVPVIKQGQQPITMKKLGPNSENQPSYSIGNIHRLDIMRMVDRYANQLHLQRQSPVPGDYGYAPWGPNEEK